MSDVKFNTAFHHTHGLVSAIEKSTAKFLSMVAEMLDTIKGNAELEALISNKVVFVDDIPMVRHLAYWCLDMRKTNPRVKFGIRNSLSFARYGGVTTMQEVWMYVPGQPYAIMRLGYKDYRTTASYGSTEYQFGLYTRLVQSQKYKEDNEQHCMVMTSDPERAVRNAKKYMRPYAPQELVRVQVSAFIESIKQDTGAINSEATSAVQEIRTSSDLMIELRNLATSDYEFVAPRLKEKILNFIEKEKAMREHNARARHAWFVNVFTSTLSGKQMFDVIEMFDVHKNANTTRPTVTYTEDDLPEEIAGKLSVLSMVSAGTRVADVGMRATETTFYVERV